MSGNYQWHFDYTRLLRDTGFTFQLNRLQSSLTRNLAHIDIDKIIFQQDIALVDRSIDIILDYTLDNEQSSVSDQNLVKIFYISQLSVQYLLFCKKYLDNTVAHLKKEVANDKEVISKLNRKIEEREHDAATAKSKVKELESTLSCQIANTQTIPVFQCNQCPQAFSTEEYLLAHIQRHESFGHGTNFQVETDKLQSEIKALKERLNTEKLIHCDDEKLINKQVVSSKNNSIENLPLSELQHKFEMHKTHVDNELKMLQTQKFDQEKYEKWFETFLRKVDISVSIEKSSKSCQSDMEFVKQCETCLSKNKEDDKHKDDHTTQTDSVEVDHHFCKNYHTNVSPRGRLTTKSASDEHIVGSVSKKENTLENFEIFQQKVTGSIEKLETQMQSFCNKFQEFEQQTFNRTTPSPKHTTEPAEVKVVPKPRKKWNPRPTSDVTSFAQNVIPSPKAISRSSTLEEQTFQVVEIQSVDVVAPNPRFGIDSGDKVNVKQSTVILSPKAILRSSTLEEQTFQVVEIQSVDVVAPNPRFGIDSADKVNVKQSTVSDSESETSTLKPKPSVPPPVRKKPVSSLKTVTATQIKQHGVMDSLDKELAELGISSEWSTIPSNTYQRAIGIVRHQSILAKKSCSNYNFTKENILKTLDEEVKKRKQAPVKTTSNLKRYQPEVVSSQKSKFTESETESETTIINRKDFKHNKENIHQPQKAYFDVIQEFASRTKPKDDSSDVSVDTDTSKKREQAKGVLKNYPSVGSLHKKKVLFNFPEKDDKIGVIQLHGEGSTTSINSSVLDGSKVNLNECRT